MRRQLCVLLMAVACAALPRAAEPARLAELTLRDIHVLSTSDIGGQRPRELSGLAWDPAEARLYAVSDRGRLFTFALEIERGRIKSLIPLAGTLIGGGRKLNAEALWLRRGSEGQPVSSELVLADETGIDAVVLDLKGQPKGSEPLPLALRERERWYEANSGVEALAWHDRHGLVAAPQRPLLGSPPGIHHVYAGSGQVWAFTAHPGGRSSIKAIELVDDGRLLVLEKIKQGDAHLTVLRELQLDECAPDAPCKAPAALLKHAQILPDDNFEGLACVGPDLCLLVTDSGGSSAGRTLLALVHVVRR